MLNKNTGEIQIGETKLDSSLSIDEFLSIPLAKAIISQRKGEYPAFHLNPQPIGETLFNLVLKFNPRGKLLRISLSISPDGKPPSWNDWSEETEQKLRAEHDKWLFKMLGKPHRFGSHGEVIYEYKWGEVFSGYDPRSASSELVISYF